MVDKETTDTNNFFQTVHHTMTIYVVYISSTVYDITPCDCRAVVDDLSLCIILK